MSRIKFWIEEIFGMTALFTGAIIILFICISLWGTLGIIISIIVFTTIICVLAKYNEKQFHTNEEIKRLEEQQAIKTYMNSLKTIQDAYSLSPEEFEFLIKQIFEKYGYDTELTSSTGDGGIDIFLYKDGKTEIVSVKDIKLVFQFNLLENFMVLW